MLVVCYVCVLVVSLCAFQQKVDSAFSKIRIKQLKHHLILIPISQRLYPIYRWLPEAVRGPPAAADAGVQPDGQNPPQEEQEVSQIRGENQEVPLPPPPPLGDLA